MTTTSEAGSKGAKIRNEKLGPEGRSEAAQKAAATRKSNDPYAFSKMGQKGAEVRHADPERDSEIARKAAQTRKENDPDAFRKMGQKGGEHSHGGGRGTSGSGRDE